MLAELLNALASQGAHYQVAAQARQYNFPPTPVLIPPSTFLCVQVTDDNVILARMDLRREKFTWSNPQSGPFKNIISLTTPIGVIPLPRVWVSVDAVDEGEPYRFIDTHLESFDATIRQLQGAELRAGPAITSMPVMISRSVTEMFEIKRPKNDKIRTGTIPDALECVLRTLHAVQAKERLALGEAYKDQDLVFAHADGSPVKP